MYTACWNEGARIEYEVSGDKDCYMKLEGASPSEVVAVPKCATIVGFRMSDAHPPTTPASTASDKRPKAQVPDDFRGTWCASSRDLKGDWSAFSSEPSACDDFLIAIDAADLKSADHSLSCTIRSVKSFDVCPWGMIFKDRERAMKKRPHQINPWSPGYDITFDCTESGQPRKVLKVDWVIEKGGIIGGLPPSYLCPWSKKK